MIASDYLVAAKAAITEGDHAAAHEYLDAARDGIRAARIEAVKIAGKTVIEDLERIQNAERLCRYAVSSGRGTPAANRLISELQAAPRLDKRKSLFGAQNIAAFEWHNRNRSEIFDLIAQAAEESAQWSQIS